MRTTKKPMPNIQHGFEKKAERVVSRVLCPRAPGGLLPQGFTLPPLRTEERPASSQACFEPAEDLAIQGVQVLNLPGHEKRKILFKLPGHRTALYQRLTSTLRVTA
jgi:hypothetical protein